MHRLEWQVQDIGFSSKLDTNLAEQALFRWCGLSINAQFLSTLLDHLSAHCSWELNMFQLKLNRVKIPGSRFSRGFPNSFAFLKSTYDSIETQSDPNYLVAQAQGLSM